MLPRFTGGETAVVDGRGRAITHPNEQIFAHLCRLRQALDALEDRLPEEEWRSVVRKARGSLTTFNFLFRSAEDQFSGKG